MKSDLADMVTAYDLSRATLRTIRMNLFWAFFYNMTGVPVAAGLLYPAFGLTLNPMMAAAAMSLSSVFVVVNALRLNLFRKSALPEQADSPGADNVCSLGGTPCISERKETDMTSTGEMKIMHIAGMSCGHCKASVEKALNALPGVRAEVDLANGQASITSDGRIPDAQLAQAVTDAGFEVRDIA